MSKIYIWPSKHSDVGEIKNFEKSFENIPEGKVIIGVEAPNIDFWKLIFNNIEEVSKNERTLDSVSNFGTFKNWLTSLIKTLGKEKEEGRIQNIYPIDIDMDKFAKEISLLQSEKDGEDIVQKLKSRANLNKLRNDEILKNIKDILNKEEKAGDSFALVIITGGEHARYIENPLMEEGYKVKLLQPLQKNAYIMDEMDREALSPNPDKEKLIHLLELVVKNSNEERKKSKFEEENLNKNNIPLNSAEVNESSEITTKTDMPLKTESKWPKGEITPEVEEIANKIANKLNLNVRYIADYARIVPPDSKNPIEDQIIAINNRAGVWIMNNTDKGDVLSTVNEVLQEFPSFKEKLNGDVIKFTSEAQEKFNKETQKHRDKSI